MIPEKNELNISFYIISKILLSTLVVIFCCVLSEHPAASKHGAPERGAWRVPEGAAETEGGDRWRAQQGCWKTQHKVLWNAERTDQISTLLISFWLSVWLNKHTLRLYTDVYFWQGCQAKWIYGLQRMLAVIGMFFQIMYMTEELTALHFHRPSNSSLYSTWNFHGF